MSKIGIIYEIRNTINNKRYVGSSINPKRRRVVHLRKLRQGKHHSIVLQRAFDKYGEESFFFSVIENNIPLTYLVEREQYWLNKLQPEYNVAKVAGSRIGVLASEETKRKISIAQKGRTLTPEHRANIAAAATGRKRDPFSATWLANMSIVKKGCKHSLKTKAKISTANRGNIPTTRKPVEQIDPHTNEVINIWPSVLHASKGLNISRSEISRTANGKANTASGFKWKFTESK